ncbi:HD2 homeodomain mating-type protein [Mycena chlorophos]|uniref:HD2 homeodomain mating-type protein n=1 Tax=Mycena chlorophos TaxID=658473 RepID=A0A8H6WC76_MYCCL|nr:HD2 homeodomain mating-type protein [Mycena chlorophos]
MAKKSGMSRRQIQVWFQNHRARTKAKTRGNAPYPQRLPHGYADDEIERYIQAMEEALDPVYVVPRELRQDPSVCAVDDFGGAPLGFGLSPASVDEDDDDEDDDDSETEFEVVTSPEPDVDIESSFDFMAPSSPPEKPKLSFSELCRTVSSDTTSPTPFSGTFTAPEWPRRPRASTPTTPAASVADWDSLTTAFADLYIHRAAAAIGAAPVACSATPIWAPATTTVVPQTPLPSLLRVKRARPTLPTRRDRTHLRQAKFGCASFSLRANVDSASRQRIQPPSAAWSRALMRVGAGLEKASAENHSASARSTKRQRYR